MNKIFLITFTKKGCDRAKIIYEGFLKKNEGLSCILCTSERFLQEFAGYPAKTITKELIGDNFFCGNHFIFISAAGIAVRYIAPFIKSKTVDASVTIVTEGGDMVIPILSGHLGGGNSMARSVAEITGGTAVITTATDYNQIFSVDDFARENGYFISSMELAKNISARLLDSDTVTVEGIGDKMAIASGLVPIKAGECPDICVSTQEKYKNSSNPVLYLIPRNIYLGIGCKRGTDFSKLKSFVEKILEEYHIFSLAIRSIASIDIKAKEPGLVKLADYFNCDFLTYSAKELSEVEYKVSGSAFVQSVTGVDNVCERAALIASGAREPLVKKICSDGMTLAICEGHDGQ